jgi:hypothetical protein
MYCKYCFIKNVSDRDEQRRIRDKFLEGFKMSEEMHSEMTDSAMLRELLDLVRMMVPAQATLLNDQFAGSPESAQAHLRERLAIRSAPTKFGRYLIGPELEGIWGERIDELIEKAPMSLMRGLKSVLTTPGILAAHKEFSTDGVYPHWVTRGMAVYTTDPAQYTDFPAAYVQTLAKGI